MLQYLMTSRQRSHAPARPKSEVPIRGKVPTDALAQPDSTPEHYPPAHPPKSDTPGPLSERMFPEAWNQTGLSMPGQYATLAGAARDWTGSCAHHNPARGEKPALARSQADGTIRNCRAPGAFAWPAPRGSPPRPRNLRTPRRRFPSRSLDRRPPGKAHTSGRRFVQRKRPFRGYFLPAHTAGESFLCPGCPGYARPAALVLRKRPPDARALRGGQPVLQLHAVPACLRGAWPHFTMSSSVLITLDTQRTSLRSRLGGEEIGSSRWIGTEKS